MTITTQRKAELRKLPFWKVNELTPEERAFYDTEQAKKAQRAARAAERAQQKKQQAMRKWLNGGLNKCPLKNTSKPKNASKVSLGLARGTIASMGSGSVGYYDHGIEYHE